MALRYGGRGCCTLVIKLATTLALLAPLLPILTVASTGLDWICLRSGLLSACIPNASITYFATCRYLVHTHSLGTASPSALTLTPPYVQWLHTSSEPRQTRALRTLPLQQRPSVGPCGLVSTRRRRASSTMTRRSTPTPSSCTRSGWPMPAWPVSPRRDPMARPCILPLPSAR